MARRPPNPRHRPATHRDAGTLPGRTRHPTPARPRPGDQPGGIRDWQTRITTAAPATAGDPTLPTLAAHLARLAKTRPDIADLLTEAADLGPLPVEHAADALRYRITAEIRKENEMHRQEALQIANTRRPLPPPTSYGPDHGHRPGIGI